MIRSACTTIPNPARPAVVAALIVAVVGTAFGQESGPVAEAPRSQVRDLAGLFGLEALREARASLEEGERTSRVPVLIETIDSLDGEDMDAVSLRRARRSGHGGIYVLISKGDRKIQIREYGSILGVERRGVIREAFTGPFAEGEPDEGLKVGVRAILLALAEARPRSADDLPPGPDPQPVAEASATRREDPRPTNLILRDQVRLTLGGARQILAASEAKASSMGLKMNIAVVDDGGHLLAFARMDGARPASGYTAMTKAATAATFRQATGPIPPGTTAPDPLLNLSLQNAAAASGGKITTLFGGVPVVVDGQVIGGVGVGGGTGEQDAEVARAGIEALASALGEDIP